MNNASTLVHTKYTDSELGTYQEDIRIDEESIAKYLEFQAELYGRIQAIAKICRDENLFDTTLGLDIKQFATERTWGHWANADIEFSNFDSEGKVWCDLTTYIGCGDYDHMSMSFSKTLLTQPLQPQLELRRQARDAYYESLKREQEAKAAKAAQAANDRLAEKRRLFEQLKKELGE